MISKRLKTIANLLNKDQVVCDVGSDHGLLAIYLIKNNIANKVYAIDNKEGPLSFAKENIKMHDVDASVFTLLSEGLSKMPTDTDAAVIAGMGYSTIKNIIENDLDKAKNLNQIIIQTNNQHHLLRKFLFDNNFNIIKEAFVSENSQDYIIMSVKYTNNKILLDPYISEYLIKNKNIQYLDYLNKRLKQLEEINKYRSDKHIKAEISSIKKAI